MGGFEARRNVTLVEAAGMTIVEHAIDDVLEDGEPVPFLCVFARRS